MVSGVQRIPSTLGISMPNCHRAPSCTMAPQLSGAHRLLQVLRSLYCDQNPHECARVKFASVDRDVPPDMLPNGFSATLFDDTPWL
jgi:hypothetical protein